MKLFRRENYLSKIRGFYHETDLIKVITGVRRCGKSSLMHTIAEELIESGINKNNTIFIDLKKRGYRRIKTPDALEETIDKACKNIKGIKYLFIDEIQNVKGYEDIVEEFKGQGYGQLKSYVADVVCNELDRIQTRYREILESKQIEQILADGANKASAIARKKLAKVEKKIGLEIIY